MRVLVVDDSTVFRKVVRDALAAQPNVEVVGVAADGRQALEKINRLKPDLVTLDVEMPELNGLEVLREMRRLHAEANVIMVSSMTTAAATQTAQALRLGAFDFILKPSEKSLEQNVQLLRAELAPKVRELAARLQPREPEASPIRSEPISRPISKRLPTGPAGIVAIGVSTGGPAALAALLPKLPANLPTPVVIVQHMPPVFTQSLADDLNRHSRLRVKEASDGEWLEAGVAYIAPGGRQMRVAAIEGRTGIRITDDPPERSCRPSVDYLFRSVADLYGCDALAVVMTGMGDDGAEGCRLLKLHGAHIAAQDQASCVVYGMPRQVVEAGLADTICPLADMHDVILARRRARGRSMKLAPGDIDAICGLVIDLCGVYLDESKGYLIESRLGDLATNAGCATYADLARKVRLTNDAQLRHKVIDAITTNETLFFRDGSPFDALRHKALPEMIDSKTQSMFPQRLRIWSAACSTGQEPYSIGMLLHELLPDANSWDIGILGTDICDDAVSRASKGWYSKHEAGRGMSPERLSRFFHEENGGWRVKDELRALVKFERRNLLGPFSNLGRFDIVFCRNVAIYFTPSARQDLFHRIAASMNPGGYLFVGSQESLSDLGPQFAPHHHCRSVYYRPTLSAAVMGGVAGATATGRASYGVPVTA